MKLHREAVCISQHIQHQCAEFRTNMRTVFRAPKILFEIPYLHIVDSRQIPPSGN